MAHFPEGAPALARPSGSSTTICLALRPWYTNGVKQVTPWPSLSYGAIRETRALIKLFLLGGQFTIRSLRTSRQVVWLGCRKCQAKAQAPDYTTHKAMTWQLLDKDDVAVQHRLQTAALNLDSFLSSQTSPWGEAQTKDRTQTAGVPDLRTPHTTLKAGRQDE